MNNLNGSYAAGLGFELVTAGLKSVNYKSNVQATALPDLATARCSRTTRIIVVSQQRRYLVH